MSETYEEWEVLAQQGKRKWRVSGDGLPVSSQTEAQLLCSLWHEWRPEITYTPRGYRVTREPIEKEQL